MASALNTRELCAAIDPDFGAGGGGARVPALMATAMAGFNVRVDDEDRVGWDSEKITQRKLSRAINKVLRRELLAGGDADLYFKAHCELVAQPGAGAWLTAAPLDEVREVEDAPSGSLLRSDCVRRL